MSTSPALRAAARVVSSGMLRNTSRLTAGGLRQKPDRKSTRLNSSHSQISYAVFLFRKNTRLNSSHSQISYAVFCLKKKEHSSIDQTRSSRNQKDQARPSHDTTVPEHLDIPGLADLD